MSGRALIVQGDALRLPLRDDSVDLIVTSPPFYSLRDYQTGHPAEIGAQPDPATFLEALWAAKREMVRVLKPTGSMWVNLGDSYADRANGGPSAAPGSSDGALGRAPRPGRPQRFGVSRKSLYGLPWMYANGCTGMLAAVGGPDPGLNLILRRDQIWRKPSAVPESAGDRTHTKHEYWFHLVRQPRYYSALDELREPYSAKTWTKVNAGHDSASADAESGHAGHRKSAWAAERGLTHGETMNPLGAMPGSVWSIASEPFTAPAHLGKHHAAFPSEWPRRLVNAFSPPGICLECGEGRFPVVDRVLDTSARPNGYTRHRSKQDATDDGHRPNGSAFGAGPSVRGETRATILGYACSCCPHTDHPERRRPSSTPRTSGSLRVEVPATGEQHAWPERLPVREYHLGGWRAPPTRPAVVLDPFAGTGTTVMVARALGRIGVGFDLSAAYCRLARWRVFESGGAAKAIKRTNLERQGALDLEDAS